MKEEYYELYKRVEDAVYRNSHQVLCLEFSSRIADGVKVDNIINDILKLIKEEKKTLQKIVDGYEKVLSTSPFDSLNKKH